MDAKEPLNHTDQAIDYHDFTTRETPVRQRREWGLGPLWINAARCTNCNETIRSRNLHDLRWCGCGKLAVDGGSWYSKRITRGEGGFEELSELFADVEAYKNRGDLSPAEVHIPHPSQDDQTTRPRHL